MKHFSLATLVVVFIFVVSLLAGPASASDEDLEREALVALYNSTNGDSWTRSDNWLDDSLSYCEWYGVVCDDTGHVQQLMLYGNQLNGPLPPEVGYLSSLQELNLNGNQLSGAIPPELGNLSSLQDLALSTNQLNGPIPPELGALGSLHGLELSFNLLNGSIPPELGNLTDLRGLWLESNQLSGGIPPDLGNLSQLRALFLNDNQLSDPIPPDLGNLSKLDELWLHKNQLSGSIPPELGNLRNLGLLYLNNNQLSGPIPPELGNLGNMYHFLLSSNQLSCWGNQDVLDWAEYVRDNYGGAWWDYPNPGEVICPCRMLPGNVLQNTCFEDGEAPWKFYSNGWGGFDTTTPAFDGSFAARVEIGSTASNMQLYQYNVPLEPNQHYRLYFAAKSNNGRDMSLYVHKHGWPYSNYGLNGEVIDLTTEWQQLQVDFTTNNLAEADGRLRFWLAPYARASTVYWLDNVYLLKITDGVPPPPYPDPQDISVPPPGHCNQPVEGNVLGNPGFEASSLTPWSFYTNGKGYAVPDANSAYECAQSAKVMIKQQGSNVQLFQPGLVLQPNTSYRLRLAAKSSGGRDVRLYLHKHRSPYTNYGLNGLPLDLTTEWQVFIVQFTTTNFSAPVTDGRLRIWLAGSDAPDVQYYFDDVVMAPLEDFVTTAMMSEGLSNLQSFSLLDRKASYTSVATGQLLTSGFFIDDDDAGRAQGAFLPPKQRGAVQCEKAKPSHTTLWPADGRMVRIKLVGIGKPTSLEVTGIWQDEPVGEEADGVIDGEDALLRAERSSGGSGRVYHVTFNASYRDGTSCTHEVLVSVPLQQGAQTGAQDEGPLANSTQP